MYLNFFLYFSKRLGFSLNNFIVNIIKSPKSILEFAIFNFVYSSYTVANSLISSASSFFAVPLLDKDFAYLRYSSGDTSSSCNLEKCLRISSINLVGLPYGRNFLREKLKRFFLKRIYA
ncbi:MAG: hypothetical protein UR45_C0004G0007 [candidate division WS6 bacterium GW2011_WS6_33_547]|nr:MAG: hypothetical protein UR45_C0004G0007 [candidate division WS6 bacterium GW2011_WS6_33_547]